MISLTIAQQNSIAGASLTLCRCWKLIRKDGKSLYFTDHDETLTISDKKYSPVWSLQSSASVKSSGTNLRDKDVKGVLTSELITEDELTAGLYRDAQVIEFLFDWATPSVGPFLQEIYWIANTSWNGLSWTATLQSLTSWLQLPFGGAYSRDCRHAFGDAMCTKNATALSRLGTCGSIVTPYTLFNTDLSGEDSPGMFNDGTILFLSGANNGIKYPVKGFNPSNGRIVLWLEPVKPIANGDTFRLYPGCDKTLKMCHEAYSNTINFGGYPDIIGNDRFVRTPDGK